MSKIHLDETPTPEEEAEAAFSTEDERRERAKTDSIIQANQDIEANRELRFRYASWVYRFLIGYSACVFLLLVASGWSLCGFELPDNVLIVLVGSTAVSAIGLVLAVVKGLFPNHAS